VRPAELQALCHEMEFRTHLWHSGSYLWDSATGTQVDMVGRDEYDMADVRPGTLLSNSTQLADGTGHVSRVGLVVAIRYDVDEFTDAEVDVAWSAWRRHA
jgi:hypothetical protein